MLFTALRMCSGVTLTTCTTILTSPMITSDLLNFLKWSRTSINMDRNTSSSQWVTVVFKYWSLNICIPSGPRHQQPWGAILCTLWHGTGNECVCEELQWWSSHWPCLAWFNRLSRFPSPKCNHLLANTDSTFPQKYQLWWSVDWHEWTFKFRDWLYWWLW